MMDPVSQTLAGASFYEALEQESRDHLAGLGQMVRRPKGALLFRGGQDIPGVYVVGVGVVRLWRCNPQGKVQNLRFVEEGQSLGEAAVIAGIPAPVSATVEEDVTCAMIPGEAFRALLDSDHAVCLALIQSMSGRLHKLTGLLEDLALRDAAGRVARYVLSHDPGAGEWFCLRILKRELAEHLNLTSETLSRTLRRLRNAGIVDMDGDQVRVASRNALVEVSEQGLPPEAAARHPG